MIRCFPDPHPDELLYSICARFSDRMAYSTEDAVVRELFGTHTVKAVVDLPSHLGRLISALLPGTSYTVDDLIDDHTLLPFYGPFLPPERLRRLRNDMSGDNGQSVHMGIGIVGCSIPLPIWLRFCPLCIVEDIKHFGECYWHRIHQVPGVEVCPVHEVFLQNSGIYARNTRTRGQFISANRVIQVVKVRQLDPSNRCHIMLLEIARDALWLLNQHGLSAELESLNERYKAALFDRDFTTYRGHVYSQKLLEAFKTHYSSDFLRLLHCELNENRKHTWLARMIHTQNIKHPLHHLLLIHFLGYMVKDFFNQPLPIEHKPFGEGPWPCLNPTSNHYRRPLIQECHISFHPKTKVRPLGTFSCTCGFAYCRIGPDQTPDDRFRIGKVKSFGLLWEATLRQLWEDHSLILSQVAHRLGVARSTVKAHAAQLGLSFNRGTGRSLKRVIPRSPKASEISKVDKLEMYRQKWLSTMEEEPDAGIEELRRKLPQIYPWLYEHDKDWLKSHLPKRKRQIKRHPSHVDWAGRDTQYVEAVKVSFVRLTSAPSRPIRLTISEISRDTGLLPSMEDHLDKLPLTALLLDEVVETHEMFAVRRILWAAELYQQEKIYPTRWQLMKRSGVIEVQKKWPRVQFAIDAALESLNPLNR